MRLPRVWLVPMLFALGAARVTAHPLAPALLDVTELVLAEEHFLSNEEGR